ncbi:hypothetical protein OKW98_15125 [Pseudomonas sp. KU26590]|uniref:hypothetical protein n=1 Tax=Pseudomonas sp. KU26590 TaxID=2991051 RepID=UPI00223DC9DC|nr:hypothetical protein [Pseudomonas sp. KU26590]UZJ57954.1 hypothetical protein OKW98_15125 [Pseudomonas sp. KU26590]
MKLFVWLSLVALAGCQQLAGSGPPEVSDGSTEPLIEVGKSRVEVPVSSAERKAAEAKALTGVEGQGWVFDPPFATARNDHGDDLAVCGHAHQPGSENTLFFAFYQGELLLWDEKAPAGVSVENEFLTLICSASPLVTHL